MHSHGMWKRLMASALSVGVFLVTIPPVGAMESVYGTVQVNGAAWVSAGSAEWSELSSTRPLVSGDRLKTGDNGFAVADLGSGGVIGLYDNAEVAARAGDDGAVIDVHTGKVAFHLGDSSNLQIAAAGASIGASSSSDGYVEIGKSGAASITAETGELRVSRAGKERTLAPGDRWNLDTDTVEHVQLAGAHMEGDPPPPPPPPSAPATPAPVVAEAPAPSNDDGGVTWMEIAGWTALAAVVGVVIYEIADDDDDEPASDK